MDVAGEERTALKDYCSARWKHLGECSVWKIAMEGYIIPAVMQKV